MGKEKIMFREWIICLFVVSSVFFLFLVSSSHSGGIGLQEFLGAEKEHEKVKVVISGAVLSPGEYEVEVGTPLKRVLDRAGFRSVADRKTLYSKKILLNSCEVFVSEKKKIGQRRCLICGQ